MPPAERAAAPGRASLDSLSTPMAIAVGVVLLAALGSCAPGGLAHLAALADACALAWPATLWIASACGLGRQLATRFGWGALRPWPAAAATGACALSAIDAAAGWAGLLSGTRSQMWAAALLLPGIASLVYELIAPRGSAAEGGSTGGGPDSWERARMPWWFGISVGIALPALVVAAASEPGALWSTEFGAYDALSYHLTLPQEWHAGDGISTLGHCAYSGMPSWMEAAYLHIRATGGGHAIGGSSWFVSAQMLHAALAVVAALCTGVAARYATGRVDVGPLGPAARQGAFATASAPAVTRAPSAVTADAVACALLLGLPWLAVTGTLAYSESLMLCALAAAMCMLLRGAATHALTRHELAALAFLAAAAFGAKPSAAILAGVPLLLPTLLLWRGRGASTRATDALACVAIVAALLAPWWLRNWLATGNPLFPFAESMLGAGAWTEEQAARFAAAHAASDGVSRWTALWQQWIAFGMGEPPAQGAAWRPLWSVMPLMIVAAAAWALMRSCHARTLRIPVAMCALVILVQVAAWLAGTHLQSRFLLPTAVPGSVLVACALAGMPRVRNSALLGVAILAWSAQPAIAFLRDGRDPRFAALWVGAAQDLGGFVQPRAGEHEFSASGPGQGRTGALRAPANLVQAINALDPASARVASVGLSATAWVRPDVKLDWCSVWDRGAVAQALAAAGGDGRAAAATLAAHGWTHLAVDQVMLDVWARAGWLDPILTPQSIDGLREGRRTVWAGPQGVLLSLDEAGTQ
jgi:hypothetical protein